MAKKLVLFALISIFIFGFTAGVFALEQKNKIAAVPFTPQAPFGNWKDPRQQDACEEASVLMAVKWAKGENLSRQQAEKEILAMAEFEGKKYGDFRDTSAEDTFKRLVKDYFGYQKAEYVAKADLEAIKQALLKGSVVIVPMNGRKLKNPYYTRPGPLEHNLLIRGYDPVKKEFITNDSGTKRGEGYRYPEKIIEVAWRDYPTGNHLPIKEIKKAMIIINQK